MTQKKYKNSCKRKWGEIKGVGEKINSHGFKKNLGNHDILQAEKQKGRGIPESGGGCNTRKDTQIYLFR